MLFPLSSVPGLHGFPARRAPTVEQAVQTVPLASAAQKRGNTLTEPQSKQPARPAQRSARSGSQVQKENIPTSKQTSEGPLDLLVLSFQFLYYNLTPPSSVFLLFETRQNLNRLQARLKVKEQGTRNKSKNKVLGYKMLPGSCLLLTICLVYCQKATRISLVNVCTSVSMGVPVIYKSKCILKWLSCVSELVCR